MADLRQILTSAVTLGASDIFIVAGRPISYKVNGVLTDYSDEKMIPAITKELIAGMYELAGNASFEKFLASGDDDLSFAINGIARFRANMYKQRGSLAAVIRVIPFSLPDPAEYHIPDQVLDFANCTKGLVLVTGPAGSGKSLTLSCIIDKINSERANHVITLEDPIEFLHPHKRSIISQREISLDTNDYASALRAALRQSPDVILVGELRDPETISIAMTAAETGHLVLSTLHTLGASNTIDRIVDGFSAQMQPQIRLQLSMVLQGVISEQLLPAKDGTLHPAFEIMTGNPAIRNMIRESKTHQIESAMQTYASEGMVTMDSSLLKLYNEGVIDKDTALAHCFNQEALSRRLK
ncbi:MAG: PilT/PilU family type 4a pilus ATPase [Eubacterium sp.]|nr:PilT/PilU family type 4a pilus ATPase [Candidatus Colimonas fimequi]